MLGALTYDNDRFMGFEDEIRPLSITQEQSGYRFVASSTTQGNTRLLGYY